MSIRLRKEFIFKGNIAELDEKILLNNNERFKSRWLKDGEYEFLSKNSIGTFYLIGFPKSLDGINLFGRLINLSENETKVILVNNVRPELRLGLFIVGISFIIGILSDFGNWHFIYWVQPIFLFSLWLIYRIQENALSRKIKTYLIIE